MLDSRILRDGMPYWQAQRCRHSGHRAIVRRFADNPSMFSRGLLAIAVLLLSLSTVIAKAPAGRTTLSLDGVWDVADSAAPTPPPAEFGHKGPVPGLAHLATPAFADVDKFASRELIDVEIRDRRRPESERTAAVGTSGQTRNYFWYRTTFRIDARRQSARLHINKAQFGTAVWLNGAAVGEHVGCFSAAILDITKQVKWKGDNELIVRIGAHPGAMPAWAPAGTDKEKYLWTPGIYDSVFLRLADNPVIETVQVAPRIANSEITVRTVLLNTAAVAGSVTLKQSVHAWKETAVVASAPPATVVLQPGERKTIDTVIKIPNAKLWSPESPSLYVVDSDSGGDTAATRFGMREFRFDTPTRRAYLNGKLIFLRGSNVCLHRFFEDPESKDRPWDEAWVRKLLGDIPKRMNWNSFRFTLGPAPEFWFDIADEAGLLIQNEFPIWQGHFDEWTADELRTEFGEWMRDHWNHPSLAVWDASNETHAEFIRDNVMPAVRELDLSGRPWDNGYSLPSGLDDPVEDHPYFFIGWWKPQYKPFAMTDLEKMTGGKTDWNSPHPTTHAVMINEYGWLWLSRDGTPSLLTQAVYEKLVGANATPQQRLEAYAYTLAGLTEYWRAHRQAAGVQYFTYLTCDYPGVKTSDNFSDVARLELEPHFADYVRESFKPLGLYINFWQPVLSTGEAREYAVMMINDDPTPHRGKLTLRFEKDGQSTARAEINFAIPPYGQHTIPVRLLAPKTPGNYILRAEAAYGGEPTVSRRKVEIK